jgi:hypothetical protein
VNLLILVVDDEPDVEVLFRQQFRRDLRADRLGTALQRLALRLRIAVGSDHDDRHLGSRRPRLGQQLKAAHPRHIDIRQDQDEGTVACIVDALK